MDPMGEKTTTTCSGDDDLPPLLPEDVCIKILVCLPVKSLLRFKSVCKSWRKLIDTSFFIDLHTTTSSSSKFGNFILQTIESACEYEDASYEYEYEYEGVSYSYSSSHKYALYGDDINMFMLSSGSSDGDGTGEDDEDDDDQKKKKTVFKVDDDLWFLPFYKDFMLSDALRMVGSCNGIICLHDSQILNKDYIRKRKHYSNYYSNPRDVSLWNPATRQFRILPRSIPMEEKKHGKASGNYYHRTGFFVENFVAFGFDVKTKDYKVLRITPFIPYSYRGDGCVCRVQVYSLSTDSWRLLEDIDYLPVVPTQELFDNHGIYLNGSCFFLGRKRYIPDGMCDDDFMLLSFDFTKEIFTTMQLPDDNSSVLSCLGEKLAVFTTPQIDDREGGYEYYDIWVLNEQHDSAVVNKESWTKLHSFRINSREGKPCTEPRCISNNGEFALISTSTDDDDDDDGHGRKKLQLFNLVTQEAKKDFLIGTGVCRADVYNESLVSIMGGGNVLPKSQLPTHRTYILNLAAPFIDSSNMFCGIGLCLTSDTGACIGVKSIPDKNLQRYPKDAEEAEALAMLEAIKWAKKLELSPIIIESNSKNCVSFFIEDDDDDDDNNLTNWSSGAHSLLVEAKLLLNSSDLGRSISLQYCSRSCNYDDTDLAERLVKNAYWPCKDWTTNIPEEMEWLGL